MLLIWPILLKPPGLTPLARSLFWTWHDVRMSDIEDGRYEYEEMSYVTVIEVIWVTTLSIFARKVPSLNSNKARKMQTTDCTGKPRLTPSLHNIWLLVWETFQPGSLTSELNTSNYDLVNNSFTSLPLTE